MRSDEKGGMSEMRKSLDKGVSNVWRGQGELREETNYRRKQRRDNNRKNVKLKNKKGLMVRMPTSYEIQNLAVQWLNICTIITTVHLTDTL